MLEGTLMYISSRRYYHHSATPLKTGTVLVPGHPDSPWGCNFYPLDQRWRKMKVWMFAEPMHAAEYGGSGQVYEVQPEGPIGQIRERPYAGDDDDLDAGIVGDQYYAARAVVIAVVRVSIR